MGSKRHSINPADILRTLIIVCCHAQWDIKRKSRLLRLHHCIYLLPRGHLVWRRAGQMDSFKTRVVHGRLPDGSAFGVQPVCLLRLRQVITPDIAMSTQAEFRSDPTGCAMNQVSNILSSSSISPGVLRRFSSLAFRIEGWPSHQESHGLRIACATSESRLRLTVMYKPSAIAKQLRAVAVE